MTDIMALLFSLFLLLPHLEQAPAEAGARAAGPLTVEEQRRLQEEVGRLRHLSRLPADQRLYLVVLDIDGDTGDLLAAEAGAAPRRIATDAEADALVAGHLASAREVGRELLYVLRLPQGGFKPHPDYADATRYRRWFARPQVAYEIAGARRR
jgi:hypothetical protein